MKKGTRIWVCDACGKRETWRKGWGYYDGVPSEANVEPGVWLPAAICSDACDDALLAQWAAKRGAVFEREASGP